MNFLDLDNFISHHVTGRRESLLKDDLNNCHDILRARIEGRSVLVIGGAGTIGASFVKAILRYDPARLYVVDTNENGLTELTRDLRSTQGIKVPAVYQTYPLNFGDLVFENLLVREGPFDIVANFAAHKHVRSEKDHYSIEAMIHNNVIRAKQLLDLLVAYPPEHFFCVSTDKATNPVNVMGASKKLMEEIILAYTKELPIATARFANVAFSNGSLLDGFLYRLMKRQPFSSPVDVRRYFVSPRESGEICLLACVMGNSGDIFFPKLREEQMKKFSDIAVALLNQLGLQPRYCDKEDEARRFAARMPADTREWPVYFFPSDTSGEKLYEEFYAGEDDIDWNRFQSLGVIRGQSQRDQQDIEYLFRELEHLFRRDQLDKATVIDLLQGVIPSFHHIEKGKQLDQRM